MLRPGPILNVTSILNFFRCEREYYLKKLKPEFSLNEYLIRGNIVHSIFSELLTEESEIFDESLQRYLDLKKKFSLLSFQVPLNTLYDEIKNHREKLRNWIEDNNLNSSQNIVETTLINAQYGLIGRIDALLEGQKLLDLKTGTCNRQGAWDNHHLQLSCYGLLLKERLGSIPTHGSILYSGNSQAEMERVEAIDSIPQVLIIREKILRTDLSNPVKPYGDYQCERCWSKEICAEVCKKLNQQSSNCRWCSLAQECEEFNPLLEVEKQYFNRFFHLIELERKTAQQELQDLWKLSLEERVEKGRTISNLIIDEIEHKPPHYEVALKGENHSDIRNGDSVIISDGNPLKSGCIGYAVQVTRHGIVVQTKQRPEKASVVDAYPLEIGFNRMANALFNFIFRKDDYFKKVVLGIKNPRFIQSRTREISSNNKDQNQALNRALSANDIFLIQGPPGTGKTYLIAEIVKELVDRGERILISAYTNRGVDNALQELKKHGFQDFIRLGHPPSIDVNLKGNILHPDIPLRDLEKVIKNIKVIGTTSTWAASESVYRFFTETKLMFDTAIIDEASQMLEPQTLSLINLAKRAILVGDHKQLPSVVRSDEAQESGLAVSMFERLVKTFPSSMKMLTRQYRMNELIEEFPNQKFYQGKMRAATGEVATQRLSDIDGVQLAKIGNPFVKRILVPDEPLVYVKAHGTCIQRMNKLEVIICFKIVEGLTLAGLEERDVAVIAPYRAQVAEIRRRLYPSFPNVDIDTVDRFQGSEREVVIISLTQSKPFIQPIFRDYRRWNVAITRAKKMLIITGHPNMQRNRMMKELLSHIEEKGKVVDTSFFSVN